MQTTKKPSLSKRMYENLISYLQRFHKEQCTDEEISRASIINQLFILGVEETSILFINIFTWRRITEKLQLELSDFEFSWFLKMLTDDGEDEDEPRPLTKADREMLRKESEEREMKKILAMVEQLRPAMESLTEKYLLYQGACAIYCRGEMTVQQSITISKQIHDAIYNA